MEDMTALREQLEYYRARAQEYDQWWLRQGRYDRGAALNAQWLADAGELYSALEAFRPSGRILELACGTGIWTERLLRFASQLTALDGSPEMLAVNAARLRSPKVRYIEADIFEWRSRERFDTVFFGFWLSHVPPERFAVFWQTVRGCLAPGGRVFFVDSRHEQTSTALDHRLPGPEATVLRRRLNDGREFQVYKVFYEPAELGERLRGLGWDAEVRSTSRYFIYGFSR
jgi:demethylmenaquinone methyltransferase/2-methoxy-6-polyprenyl-1,4-benzoquinol methylase